jgi:hypothetical protein
MISNRRSAAILAAWSAPANCEEDKVDLSGNEFMWATCLHLSSNCD